MSLVAVIALMGIVVGVSATLVHAQASIPPPESLSYWDMLLVFAKAMFPAMLSFGGGFITKGVQIALGKLPANWAAFMSSAFGSLLTLVASAIQGFSAEQAASLATLGAAGGAASHAAIQTRQIETHPPDKAAA